MRRRSLGQVPHAAIWAGLLDTPLKAFNYAKVSRKEGFNQGCQEYYLLAAGFDVVFVETVGVGQSELMVSELTDIFVLVVAPGAGDELQVGIAKV